MNIKCTSQKKRFHKLNLDDRSDMEFLTLNIILCIFKKALNKQATFIKFE